MSKIKIKQIFSEGQPDGAILTANGDGTNSWLMPEVASGANTYLGDAEDGSYTESRYTGGRSPAVGLQPTTKVSTAIDSINEVLGLLLPTAPANLSTGVLTLSTANSSAKAAQGYNANSLTNAPAAGSTVTRIVATTADTITLQDLGSGNSGAIALVAQDAPVSGEQLAFTDNTGDMKTTGLLRITDNKWGGFAVGGGAAPDGFFQTFDSQVVGATAALGLNHLQLSHSVSGNTNILSFVRDDLTAVPAVSAVAVAEGTATKTKISGIDHYAAGSTLNLAGTATNLAGQTYANGTILSMAGPGAAVNFAPGQAGLPTILNVNTLSFNMAAQAFTVGGNVFSKTAKITLTANNPNGSGNGTHATNLIVFSGANTLNQYGATAFTVAANGATAGANRVFLGTTATGDTPAASTVTGNATGAIFDNTQSLAAAGYTHEAALVGGSYSHDLTNYTTGYLPVGLDYSGKDSAAQYVTFRFNVTAKSAMTVNITGTYAGMWVALPGVSTGANSPAAINGAWWDAKALYSGAGYPGKSGDAAAGCANGTVASGSTGSTIITFGAGSSASATNNAVFVRVKLTPGQSITNISIS